jgi:hypothetical protein
VDPELTELASTAAITVVKAMTTDGWEAVKTWIKALWHHVYPESAETLTAELVSSHSDLIAARKAGDQEIELELTRDWQAKFRDLLASHPDAADALRELIRHQLPPMLSHDERSVHSTTMTAFTSDHGRAYQAAGDMHITDQREA